MHVVLTFYGNWLPGDPRGWRSRNHRRHSSGDYKNPPPANEHRGLYERTRSQVTHSVNLSREQRESIGERIIEFFDMRDERLLCLAVAATHTHLLCELPPDDRQQRRVIGSMKSSISRTFREKARSKLWAGGGRYIPIRDRQHQRQTYAYIMQHASQGAWTWSFQQPPKPGLKP